MNGSLHQALQSSGLFYVSLQVVIDQGPGSAPVGDFGFARVLATAGAKKKICRGLGWKIHKNLMSERTKSADFLSRFSLMHMVYSRLFIIVYWFIVSYDSANMQKHHKSHRMQ